MISVIKEKKVKKLNETKRKKCMPLSRAPATPIVSEYKMRNIKQQ